MKPYYEDEWVTLYHGDCLELADVWTCADVLVTDPPYGVKWRGTSNYRRGGAVATQKWEAGIAGDESVEVRDAALSVWGKSKPQIVFGSWRAARPLRVDHRLIWHKKGQAPGPLNSAFMVQDEEIYIAGEGFIKSSPPMRSVIATSEARSVEVARIGHPTPKPVSLMEMLIERAPVDWLIADPFAGSGSTLVAARNLGRKVIGVELEEKYCELIAKRLDATPLPLLVETPAAPATATVAFDLGERLHPTHPEIRSSGWSKMPN